MHSGRVRLIDWSVDRLQRDLRPQTIGCAVGAHRPEAPQRTCPRCGKAKLMQVELLSGTRDVCTSCGYSTNPKGKRKNET